MLKRLLVPALILLAANTIALAAPSHAMPPKPVPASANGATFSPAQVSQIQKVTHDYLVAHPEILIEMSQALEAKRDAHVQNQSHSVILNNKQALFHDPHTPWIGSTKPTAYLVEFSDYQCGYCKAMAPIVEDLVKTHKNVRILYKALPIFGETSEFAAKAALASAKQGKYLAFHRALFKSSGQLSKKKVFQIARTVGINTQKLTIEMEKPRYSKQLKASRELAMKLQLRATPAFVIANGSMTQTRLLLGAKPGSALSDEIGALEQKR